MKTKIFLVAALVISSQAYSQIFPQKKKDTIVVISGEFPYLSRDLDKVIVTANKYPRKQSETGKVIDVIDKKMLARLQGRSLGEILNTVAGVTVNGANNNLGTNQRVSIRGSSDGNVLILVDGIPVNDPSVITNYFDLNFINPSLIERTEVLKGGQSVLYGSDAVAGVINIITKKNERKKIAPYASASFGSYNTVNGNVGISGLTKIISYNSYLAGTSSTGFSSAYDSTGKGGFDKDGFNQYVLHNDIGLRISNRVIWNFFETYSNYKTDVDAAAFTDDKDFIVKNKNLQTGSVFEWKQQRNVFRILYQFNHVNRFYFDDSVDRKSFSYYSVSRYIGRTHFAEINDNYKWRHVSVLAGIDLRYYNTDQFYHSVSQFGPFDEDLKDSLAKMHQLSGYTSVVYSNGGANIEGGARLDHHNIYGNDLTYTFNPSYLLRQKLKLFANISSAFKTPSLFQLFDSFVGNPGLNPEKSDSREAGFEIYPIGTLRLRATAFYRKTKNAIQFIITDPVFFSGHYENITHQKNYGVEASISYEGEKWSINSNYTFTKGKVSSAYSESGDLLAKDTSYNNLYRVPQNAVNVFVAYSPTKKIGLNCLIKYVGKRLEPVFAAAPKELDDYFTIDIGGQYNLAENARAFLSLKNITNKRYFDILGYNSRRFNFTAGISLDL
jgi:vitamin B12 transporter